MRKALLATFATVVVALSMAGAVAPASEGNGSATGDCVRSNGSILIFNAINHRNGITTGSLYSESPSGFIFTVDFDRLTFSTDGRSAYLHGVVTYANLNPALVGRQSICKVTDNGEGYNSDPDAVTAIVNPATPIVDYITFLDGLSSFGILDGNIQVRSR